MIDHIGLRVASIDASARFYLAALAPLGYSIRIQSDDGVGLGNTAKPDLWLYPGEAPSTGAIHLALAATDQREVDEFFDAAIAAGAVGAAEPRLRPEYHPGYYGAFVLDPDGYNLEVVHHSFPVTS